jgi:2-oxoglutarate dehydrogenase complex dihydrolipoamide succinyltransferase (E2) component
MSVKVIVPQIGQSIAEATIVKWFKKPGESIEKGETLVEIGTDKINTEIPAPESGVIQELLVKEGETVAVQSEIAIIASSEATKTEPQIEISSAQRYSPVVRRLAQENQVDLAQLRGTGEGGRITKEDVLNAIKEKPAQTQGQTIAMSRMRKLISEHMVRSKRTTAELTTFFEIDMTPVVMEREKAKEIYQKEHGLKLTYLPFVIAGACKALKAFPMVNSSIDGENIVYKEQCNVGIATAVEEGLIVPVIRDAEKKNILDLAKALGDLGERARTNRLSADDLSDGSFTITNPGVFGALMGTPIINFPQVAILEVGAIEKRVVVINDAIVIRSMAYFSLTYDHRAMDGANADGFMALLKRTLENECPLALA